MIGRTHKLVHEVSYFGRVYRYHVTSNLHGDMGKTTGWEQFTPTIKSTSTKRVAVEFTFYCWCEPFPTSYLSHVFVQIWCDVVPYDHRDSDKKNWRFRPDNPI